MMESGRRNRDVRRNGGQEVARGGGATPVVAELEHLSAKRRGVRQESVFRRRLDVAGKKHRSTSARGSVDAHDQRAIVGRSAPRPRWPKRHHPERPVALCGGALAALRNRHASIAGGRFECGKCRISSRPVWQPDLSDRNPFYHARQTTAVIEIPMGCDYEIEVAYTELSQRGEDRGDPMPGPPGPPAPRVDQHSSALPLHQRSVALADVEKDHAGKLRPRVRGGQKRQHPRQRESPGNLA